MGNLRDSSSEDYIDFECSDTFRGFFYERGLTPHPPAASGPDNLLRALQEEIRALRQELADQAVNKEQAPVRAPQGRTSPESRPSINQPSSARRPIWTDSP
jgi:hypothetical protein